MSAVFASTLNLSDHFSLSTNFNLMQTEVAFLISNIFRVLELTLFRRRTEIDARLSREVIVGRRRRRLTIRGSFEMFSVCENSSKCLPYVPDERQSISVRSQPAYRLANKKSPGHNPELPCDLHVCINQIN
jgi:hypothetical protein